MASLFTACLGVVSIRNDPPQLSLVRHVSHLLAAIGFAANICGILSIMKWAVERSRRMKVDRISELHKPGQNTGLNIVQELLSKTRETKVKEESRTSWMI